MSLSLKEPAPYILKESPISEFVANVSSSDNSPSSPPRVDLGSIKLGASKGKECKNEICFSRSSHEFVAS